MEKFLSAAAIVIALGAGVLSLNVAGVVGPQGPKGEQGVAGKDGRNGVDGRNGSNGITVGAVPSGDISQPINASGGIVFSKSTATSSITTTQTLTIRDIVDPNTGSPFDTVRFTPNTGATTLTLPASSTLTSFIPLAGQTARQCWYNATGTAATNITFAAGTGIDLEVASSTILDAWTKTILPDNSSCLEFQRKGTGANARDIIVRFVRYADGD